MIYKVNEGKVNYSQRNNELNPHGSCNVTSMVMALCYMGYTFPEGRYKQPEDNLYDFMLTNEQAKQVYESFCKGNQWARDIPPMQIHEVLSSCTNMWLGKQVTKFAWGCPIVDIINEIKNGRPVVLSGSFQRVGKPPLGHIVVMTGYDEVTKEVYYDDPYGPTYNWNPNLSGKNSKVSWELFIRDIKDVGNAQRKWAHLFW